MNEADEDYEYIITTYNVPAKTGRRIRYTGELPYKDGTVVKSFGHYLGIRLDGEEYVGRYHPTWALDYLDEKGNVIASFKG
jgi:hypothetical protein